MTTPYQFILIDGDEKRAKSAKLLKQIRSTLKSKIKDLGLDPDREVKFLLSSDIALIDQRGPIVAVYFGAKNQNKKITAVVDDLCSKGIFVLPVVQDLNKVSKLIPNVLQDVNVLCLEAKDRKMDAVASRLLEELRLLRSRRLVFISYKRSDSRTLAVQLYQALDERTFDVFLDTHSVDRGAKFQPMLWDNMGDSDLVILLDTPNAFSSTWVEQEISRAHALGLGILQIVWPGHTRMLGTHLCSVLYLENSDFIGGKPSSSALLKPAKLAEIAILAESLRARSMAARRSRIIGELCRSASSLGIAALPHVMGPVIIKHPKKGAIVVLPIVGHPDSNLIHETFETNKKYKGLLRKRSILIYDPLGMLPKKQGHLYWLNDFLPIKTIPVTGVEKWLK